MDVSKMNESKKMLERNTFGQETKKVLKDGKNIYRLVGDFCMSWKLWVKMPDPETGEMKSLPFIVAVKNNKGIVEKSPLLMALTGGSLIASENNYRNGLYEYELVGEKGKRKRAYKYSDTEIFQWFASNGEEMSDKDLLSVRPQAEIIVNCIDREDDWCLENNHTKLLVKSESMNGISSQIWEGICAVAELNGTPEEYDVITLKQGKGSNTNYTTQRAVKKVSSRVIEGFLTDEENAYAQYDVFEKGKLSSANYILKYLADAIMAIDDLLGTDYREELEQIALIEEKEPKQEKQEIKQSVKQPIKQETKTVSKPIGRVPVKKEEEKKKEPVPTAPCESCGTEFPLSDTTCPNCGMQYEVE